MMLSFVFCAACSAPSAAIKDGSGAQQAVTSAASSPRLEPGIYSVSDGRLVTEQAMLESLSGAKFVLLGEQHDDVWHHQKQAQLFGALARRRATKGGKVWLGLEMIQAPYQDAVDRFWRGESPEEEMLSKVEWKERWGFDVSFYRASWHQSVVRGWPIVALNAPREMTKRVAKVGLSGLTPQERGSLPEEIDTTNEAHQGWVREIFEQHGAKMDDGTFMRFYEAQVVWDETMADRAWQALLGQGEDQMVILVGEGHLRQRHGIPGRLERRGAPRDQVKTVVFVSTPGAERSLGVKTEVTQEDLARWQSLDWADYVWVQ